MIAIVAVVIATPALGPALRRAVPQGGGRRGREFLAEDGGGRAGACICIHDDMLKQHKHIY